MGGEGGGGGELGRFVRWTKDKVADELHASGSWTGRTLAGLWTNADVDKTDKMREKEGLLSKEDKLAWWEILKRASEWPGVPESGTSIDEGKWTKPPSAVPTSVDVGKSMRWPPPSYKQMTEIAEIAMTTSAKKFDPGILTRRFVELQVGQAQAQEQVDAEKWREAARFEELDATVVWGYISEVLTWMMDHADGTVTDMCFKFATYFRYVNGKDNAYYNHVLPKLPVLPLAMSGHGGSLIRLYTHCRNLHAFMQKTVGECRKWLYTLRQRENPADVIPSEDSAEDSGAREAARRTRWKQTDAALNKLEVNHTRQTTFLVPGTPMVTGGTPLTVRLELRGRCVE